MLQLTWENYESRITNYGKNLHVAIIRWLSWLKTVFRIALPLPSDVPLESHFLSVIRNSRFVIRFPPSTPAIQRAALIEIVDHDLGHVAARIDDDALDAAPLANVREPVVKAMERRQV